MVMVETDAGKLVVEQEHAAVKIRRGDDEVVFAGKTQLESLRWLIVGTRTTAVGQVKGSLADQLRVVQDGACVKIVLIRGENEEEVSLGSDKWGKLKHELCNAVSDALSKLARS